jgi:hypothetical protein
VVERGVIAEVFLDLLLRVSELCFGRNVCSSNHKAAVVPAVEVSLVLAKEVIAQCQLVLEIHIELADHPAAMMPCTIYCKSRSSKNQQRAISLLYADMTLGYTRSL